MQAVFEAINGVFGFIGPLSDLVVGFSHKSGVVPEYPDSGKYFIGNNCTFRIRYLFHHQAWIYPGNVF